jgi:hypothetical protein
MKQRKAMLLITAAICLVSSFYLYYSIEIMSFYALISLSVLTILLPLAGGLYVYKGKPARFWLVLAAFALLCAVVFTVDATATLATFKAICDRMGPEYHAVSYGIFDDYACSAGYEVDPKAFYVTTVSSAFGAVLFWPYALVVLINVLHVPYMFWRFIKK